MDELPKTYTLANTRDGWRVNFSTGIAPGFGLEPHYSLRQVIGRVEDLYPEYRPRLTSSQLEDYTFELDRLVDEEVSFAPTAVNALMRCAPPELPVSKRLALQEDARRAFETGDGLMEVIGKLENGKSSNEVDANSRISGTEESYFVDSESPEIKTIISQTTELREGLIDLTKRLSDLVGQDRADFADSLTTLHHRLSDLRAHVDIARREVALAKRVGLGGKRDGTERTRFQDASWTHERHSTG
jgi:hypothetical protein